MGDAGREPARVPDSPPPQNKRGIILYGRLFKKRLRPNRGGRFGLQEGTPIKGKNEMSRANSGFGVGECWGVPPQALWGVTFNIGSPSLIYI